MELPTRLPLPAKITIEVLPPIDLAERFGPNLNHDRIYEQVTAEMQRTLSKLQEEGTAPLVG